MIRANSRIVGVTALLAGLGAFLGAACGAATVGGLLVIRDGPSVLLDGVTWSLLIVPTGFGAVTGALIGPAIAWTLLRHVPLGRAMLWTALGTIVAAAIGELVLPFNPYTRGVPAVIFGGIAGFVIAAIAVRIRTPRQENGEVIEPAA